MKVLLVGLDGASWSFMDPMLARGALPNLKRLIDEGVHAPLRTLKPSLSVVIWTSMATGKSPSEHGITGWEILDKDTGERTIVSSAGRKVEALWTIVSQAGLSAGFVNWWATWPAEPVRGFIVSDQFSRREREDLTRATYPVSLATELERTGSSDWPWLRQMMTEGQLKVLADRCSEIPAAGLTEARWKEALFLYGHDFRGEQAALRLLATRARPDLFGILLSKIDVASHYMWRFLPREERDEVFYSRLLEPVYVHEDELLGRLIERSGPAVNVVVISDHGFQRVDEGYGHQEFAPHGVFIAWGPAFRRGVELVEVSIYDVAPTVLHLLGLPAARDMEGRVLEEALSQEKPVQWVDSYETGQRKPQALKSPVERRIREQLKSLGYIP